MRMICEIIPDLGNGPSGFKGVFDKISDQTGFAHSSGEYEEIIQPGDYRYFRDHLKIKVLRGILIVNT